MQDLHRTARRDPQPPQGGRNRALVPTRAWDQCSRTEPHTQDPAVDHPTQHWKNALPMAISSICHGACRHKLYACYPQFLLRCPCPCPLPPSLGAGGDHLKVLWLRHAPAPGRDRAQGFGPGIGHRPGLLCGRQAGGRDGVRHRCAAGTMSAQRRGVLPRRMLFVLCNPQCMSACQPVEDMDCLRILGHGGGHWGVPKLITCAAHDGRKLCDTPPHRVAKGLPCDGKTIPCLSFTLGPGVDMTPSQLEIANKYIESYTRDTCKFQQPNMKFIHVRQRAAG